MTMKSDPEIPFRRGVAGTTVPTASPMTFGEFVVSAYDTWRDPGTGAMLSFAIDAGLVAVSGPESNGFPFRSRFKDIPPLLDEAGDDV